MIVSQSHAQTNTTLSAPALDMCAHTENISKCEVVCKRSLGEQCLITHINFEGNNLQPAQKLFRAKFQTCKNANLDFQISSLAVELEKLDERETEARITSSVRTSGNQVSLEKHNPIRFNKSKIDGRLSRVYFNEFINSGESFVEAEITLQQCGHADGNNSCRISGTLVAVTDPNVRCDFHDTSKPGAYISDLQKDSKNKVSTIGRIGSQ